MERSTECHEEFIEVSDDLESNSGILGCAMRPILRSGSVRLNSILAHRMALSC